MFVICAISLTVPQKDIYYISWNIDACEGIGFLQTDNSSAGDVTIFSPLELLEYVYSFIDGLRDEGIPVKVNGIIELQEITDEE